MSYRRGEYYVSNEKVGEIQRKLVYMRAHEPPKGSLNVTRDNSSNDASPSRRSNSIHELFLNDYKYHSLKESLKHRESFSKSSMHEMSLIGDAVNGTESPSGNHHMERLPSIIHTNDRSPQQRVAHQILSHSLSHSSDSQMANNKNDDNGPFYPLAEELAERGLTLSCTRRKMQAVVRKEIEAKLILKP